MGKSTFIFLFCGVITLAAIIFIVGHGTNPSKEENVVSSKKIETKHPEDNQEYLLADSIMDCIYFINLDYPDIVFAQAKLESGNFQSSLFKKANNLMGMKMPRSRNNVANRLVMSSYAYYKNWRYSLIDYALYQSTYLDGLSRKEYFEFLDKYYARDPNYSKKLKQLIN